MKRLLPALLAVWFPALGFAAGRERVRIDDGWKFHLLEPGGEEPAGAAYAKGEPVKSWRWKIAAANPAEEQADAIRIGLDDKAWAVCQPGEKVIPRGSTFAWFRATLPAAAPDVQTRLRLHFDGVDDNATVWLNGRKIGEHSGWNEAFDVPLDTMWNHGGQNIVAVLVENTGGLGGIDAAFLQSDRSPADDKAITTGPASVGFDDKAWRDVRLPHDFVVEGTFDEKADPNHGFRPAGAGWYRRTFTLPESDRGRVLWVEFDGVYRDSIVWLNGHRLGRHASGYTSFYYDISQAANYGGNNVLTVWADARQFEGWWYEGGGIYRHVYLTKMSPVHVAHWGTRVLATPSEDFKSATVDVGIDLDGDGGVVENQIVGPDGKPVVLTGLTGGVQSRFAFADPELWSPDAPRLYTLRTTVRHNGEIVDQVDTPFGVRSLRWDKDRGFFLNGKSFKIQGTCNHQDFAGVGVAIPDAVHYYKVRLLKEMGSNAFRFSHQPMAPELLEACDRLGMVVMDENRKLGDSPEILSQVESMVRRDRNHPSIILWSMCNEEREQGSERGKRQFAAMKETVLKWDRSRPVTAAMHGGYGGGISLVTDLQGFNYHVNEYDNFHAKFPGLPCYGSETASETITRGEYADDRAKGYVSSQKLRHQEAWKPIAERAWMAGGFVWTGFDYRGEPTPYKWPCVNSHFGIMDTCGFPKDSYYYYLAAWGGQPVAHIVQHWNHAGEEGKELPVWIYGNAAKYELFLNGASLGVKDMPAHERLEWKVAYQPGALEARGYNAGGQIVATDKVETTGIPARLVLEANRPVGHGADDAVMVCCTVVDAQGHVVPTADNEITFSTDSPKLRISVGNGDPSDHDPDRASKRRAFHGKCLAVVESKTGRLGFNVTLKATAAGLPEAALVLRPEGY